MTAILETPSAGRTRASVRALLSSKQAFCVAVAFLMVVLRLVSFDYRFFFKLYSIPNHDMSDDAGFFATNMHAMRLYGDIVWWNPMFRNGYAQYFQSFLSPLAPTPNHIVFILWAQCIRGLGLLGVRIPEYFQYLTITYILLPFLTFLVVTAFASLIFRNRTTVFLILIVYTFSGIGLWNSAWFYFQEPFTLFFLLAASIAMLQKPTVRRMALFLAALVIQATSLNYWTIYNSWFVIILIGGYSFAHRNQVRRLYIRSRVILREHKRAAILLISLLTLTIGVWIVLILSIAVEQTSNYVRPNGTYNIFTAYDRVEGLRTITTELFNPTLQRALQSYKILNDMHNARYIGAFLLPLLLLVPVYRWRRREQWLAVSTVGVLMVCMAPPFLLAAWAIIPFMNRIQHQFYFYTQYWQLMLLLLAGAGMDMVLRRDLGIVIRRRFLVIITSICGLMVLLFIGFGSFSQMFPANDPNIQSNLTFAIVALIASVAIGQVILFPTAKNRQVFITVFLLLAITDMTRYFWDVSLVDNNFTATQRFGAANPVPLPASTQAALRRPWPAPDPHVGADANMGGNMPIYNEFWPANYYFDPKGLLEARASSDILSTVATSGPILDFYRTAEQSATQKEIQDASLTNPGFLLNNLLLQGGSGSSQSDRHDPASDLRFDPGNTSLWQFHSMQSVQPGTYIVGKDPYMTLSQQLNACVGNYRYLYIRMAAPSDITGRTMQFFANALTEENIPKDYLAATIPLQADNDMHAYVYDLTSLGIGPRARLTGLRIDPVTDGAPSGQSQVQIADVRLVGNDQPDTCSNQSVMADFTYTGQTWQYNTLSFDVDAPQSGWLLIRQTYDPLWHLTIDGKPVQATQADFAAMALPITGGHHVVRMDYRPLARRLYWPACLLLEITLVVLFMVSLRPDFMVFFATRLRRAARSLGPRRAA